MTKDEYRAFFKEVSELAGTLDRLDTAILLKDGSDVRYRCRHLLELADAGTLESVVAHARQFLEATAGKEKKAGK